MERKLILIFFILVLALGSASATSNYNYSPETATPDSHLKGQVVYVPQGVTTNVVLGMPINSETTTLGSNINATLAHDFSYNGKTIAPAGSVVTGTVVIAKKAGRANHNGEIMIRFNNITTPQNFTIPISAVIKTSDNTGILRGGTKIDAAKNYAVNTGIGAGGGAVLGTALGALAGGSVGKGAVYGTAIGAGLGLIKGTIDKGESVEIPANSVVEIYFEQPITTAAPLSSYGY